MAGKSKIKESPLFWPAQLKAKTLLVLDETRLPFRTTYIKVTTAKQAIKVIRDMKTRAFGQFLVVLNTFLLEIKKLTKKQRADREKVYARIKGIADDLNKSRPTFPFSEVTGIIVRWATMAIDSNLDICSFVQKNTEGYLETVRARRLGRVQAIAEVIRDGDSILTHCNVSGELAMAAALCRKDKKDIRIFATETRPYFQGAKLTCWELEKMKVPVTLVADNAVGSLMSDQLVNKVIVGSDRSCANGDFANKIGTYQIAVTARHFNIPMYVLTQPSDKIRTLKDIPIELRKADEVLKTGGKKTFRGKVDAFYPGFDVVPRELIYQEIPLKVSERE